jgi:signal transduction histidine kinase
MTAYLAIAAAGLSSLGAVYLLVAGVRPDRGRQSDGGSADNRGRLEEIDRKIAFLTRYVEEQIPRVVVESLRGTVNVAVDENPSKAMGQDSMIVREIAHSLNTPLAQIEASVLSMRGTDEEQKRKLAGIIDGVRVCKSVVATYREVATLSRDSTAWRPDSLRKALHSLGTMVADRVGRTPEMTIDVPDTIPGYDNNFIVAVLLPILENAVEAAPDGGSVTVRYATRGDGFQLQVSNPGAPSPLPADIYQAGFTTKHKHEGLGLHAVRNLLTLRDGTIRHEVQDGRLTFIIELPRGRK